MNVDFAWYQKTHDQILLDHDTSIDLGLTTAEVQKRRQDHGSNSIEEGKKKSPWKIWWSQFSDFLVLVLIGAAIIAGFLGEPQDIIAILTIIILNAVLGFTQEYRAEKSMAALKALISPQARVKRQGQVKNLPAAELVPGDIVYIEAGNSVPADLRLVDTMQLMIDESTLTGESQAVEKQSQPINAQKLSVADQKNMAFKGTAISSGRAIGVVVSTGMKTELGKIAQLLKQEVDTKTPLQNRIARFAKSLAIAVIALCVVIFLIGLYRGEEPVRMILTALSLAVAAIPEALPAVVTVTLAIGARTMSRKKALVRKLPAVEALGSVTYVCTDKTGTLTENKMRAQEFRVLGGKAGTELLGRMMALNNDVSILPDGKFQGDPTEVALYQQAATQGFDKTTLEKDLPRAAEIPFSSDRGLMTTVHQAHDGQYVFTKGAPEKVLPLCKTKLAENGVEPFDASSVASVLDEMASQALRVLAFAYRKLNSEVHLNGNLHTAENDLTFVALVGLMDPPRPEAKEAIESCRSAGVHVVMITGDHPTTAQAIAMQLGLFRSRDEEVVTGQALYEMDDEELAKHVKKIVVYARVAPEQKIRIVQALQTQGEIVAMTGDGVNDAPALRRSDIGVSMGKNGTDVAREASSLVLLDDNFASIVSAIREGRRIYDNIRKFIRFALSGNSGEVWTLFLAQLIGLPTPLLPIHILWVNLVTDGLPGLALAFEPEEKNIMQRRPRQPKESVFAHGLWQHSVWVGILTAAVTLGAMAWAYYSGSAHWQSIAFLVLTFTQMGHVLAIRSEKESFFKLGVHTNWPLFGTVILTLILQLCTIYISTLNGIFKTQPLSMTELIFCFLISSVVFFAVEIEKAFKRRRQ